ncbi:MAG: hypothetical protein H7231_07400 [Rhodoferax sp.]|nr:hypothetical protein [Actinomycetota bacterium]
MEHAQTGLREDPVSLLPKIVIVDCHQIGALLDRGVRMVQVQVGASVGIARVAFGGGLEEQSM